MGVSTAVLAGVSAAGTLGGAYISSQGSKDAASKIGQASDQYSQTMSMAIDGFMTGLVGRVDGSAGKKTKTIADVLPLGSKNRKIFMKLATVEEQNAFLSKLMGQDVTLDRKFTKGEKDEYSQPIKLKDATFSVNGQRLGNTSAVTSGGQTSTSSSTGGGQASTSLSTGTQGAQGESTTTNQSPDNSGIIPRETFEANRFTRDISSKSSKEAEYRPWINPGEAAYTKLTNAIVNGDFSDFYTSPGYEWRKAEGEKTIFQQQNAGKLPTAGAAKALVNYGQNAASSEYQNYLSNLEAISNKGYNALSDLNSLEAYYRGSSLSAVSGAAAGKLNALGSEASYLQQGQDTLGAGLASATNSKALANLLN